jgi:hypothetical protein
MTWTCRFIPDPELDEHGNVDIRQRQIGDMWFLELSEEELRGSHLSDYYWQNNSSRKPLVVLLPHKNYPDQKCYFLIDGKCYNQSQGHYGGWTVTGVPPFITVAPSINMEGRYHGFLQNGVVGDPL